jgi:hypothetical protein
VKAGDSNGLATSAGTRFGIIGVVLTALTTAACTTIYPGGGGPPTVIYSTPTGSQVVTGGQPNAVGMAGPPPGMEAGPPGPVAMGGDRSGTYSGVLAPLDTAGGQCINNVPVQGFRVHGNAVRWGYFRGRIQGGDGLQMVNGATWVTGQFEGNTFHGTVSTWGGRGPPGCSFIITLAKTGS